MSKITYIYSSHGYCSHMSNMRKYLKDTDNKVTGPKSRKYLSVTDIVIIGQ